MAEAMGLPGFEAVSWHVLMAPAATPRPIVERLHGEMTRITGDAAFQKRVSDIGLMPLRRDDRGDPEIHQERARTLGRRRHPARACGLTLGDIGAAAVVKAAIGPGLPPREMRIRPIRCRGAESTWHATSPHCVSATG